MSDDLERGVPAGGDRGFFGHPRGLSTLFFTEMWERFSYYGMRGFLVLFMTTAAVQGGLGFEKEHAGLIYGIYTAMVYLLALPGGWIADRFLGQRKAVVVGGVLIMLGHISLALPAVGTFYLGLALVAFGTGFLKPNISTMVGRLYADDDHRRDAGFSIFYMGINLGAFFGSLACGYLAEKVSWHLGFGAAAIGMFFGLIQYMAGAKRFGDVGARPVPPKDEAEARRNRHVLAAIIVGLVGVPALLAGLHLGGVISITADLFKNYMDVLLGIAAVIMFISLFTFGKWLPAEKRRLLVVLLLFVGAVAFFAGFEQAGSTLTLFAAENTTTTVLGFEFPASWFQSLNALLIMFLAPVFAWLWVRMGKNEPSAPTKFGFGMALLGFGFLLLVPAGMMADGGEKVTPLFLMGMYFIHTCGELCLSPVGLSSMTRLAPTRIGGMVMGIWFFGSACGNYLSGRAVSLQLEVGWTRFFVILAVGAGAFSLLFFVLSPRIRRMLAASPEPRAGAGH
jgi:POT family proton-dependent oligopeptide transporter